MSGNYTPFKQWQSPLSLEDVFSNIGKPQFLELKQGCLYWMEQNPEIGGVQIKGRQTSGEVFTVTTPKLNVRTKVNEYGGKAFCVGDDAIYFCNNSDQRIYRLPLNHDFYAELAAVDEEDFDEEGYGEDEESFQESSFGGSFNELFDANALIDTAQPITPDDGRMYADLCLSSDGNWLFFVMETDAEPENRTEIGMISTKVGVSQPKVLATGCDFYASLVLSPDNKQLTWVEWRHPLMPWDETHVVIGELDCCEENHLKPPALLSLSNTLDSAISGIGLGASISHLAYEPAYKNGKGQRLFMIIDWPNQSVGSRQNYAQLYCWDGNALFEITQGINEYSYPHWNFGNHRYAFLEQDKILAIATNQWGDELHLIDLKAEKILRIADKFVHFSSICAENGIAYLVAESEKLNPQIIRLTNTQIAASQENEVLTAASVSCAAALTIDVGSDSINTHAFFYAPKNIRYPSNEPDFLPPLVVMVHGGPTARASSQFDVQKQFWTTSGFAVLDVNHRGSTGYGRNYRDQLLGQWGVIDAEDIKLAIEHVIEKGMVHSKQIFIRGKSAGGYAVQRALTLYPEMFAGGASYYGIGDLATLAQITHKFESCYTDRLLGEAFDVEKSQTEDSVYFQRSPIHKIDDIKAPMILFQGLDDNVVPAELSQQVADALDKSKIHYEYHTYPGEGHGFVGMTAKVDSLTKELLFYRNLIEE